MPLRGMGASPMHPLPQQLLCPRLKPLMQGCPCHGCSLTKRTHRDCGRLNAQNEATVRASHANGASDCGCERQSVSCHPEEATRVPAQRVIGDLGHEDASCNHEIPSGRYRSPRDDKGAVLRSDYTG